MISIPFWLNEPFKWFVELDGNVKKTVNKEQIFNPSNFNIILFIDFNVKLFPDIYRFITPLTDFFEITSFTEISSKKWGVMHNAEHSP